MFPRMTTAPRRFANHTSYIFMYSNHHDRLYSLKRICKYHFIWRNPFPSSTQLTRYCYRTFTFDKAYYMRHRVLGWNTYTHVNVIQHQMAFHNRAFLLICQIVQHFPYMLPDLAKYQFLSSLRNKYHMIFTIPARMAQTLVLLHLWLLVSWLRRERYDDCRNGQTFGSPPAEPGVYLLLIIKLRNDVGRIRGKATIRQSIQYTNNHLTS